MSSPKFTARAVRSIADVDPLAWDRCANPFAEAAACPVGVGERYNPFLTHAFLLALEASGSATARAGWSGAHVLVEEANRLVAAAPAYLKSHSMGEYVFDHGWADAYARVGGDYYPKLQVCVPFTPATGRRLLVAADAPAGAREALVAGLRAVRRGAGASSVHVTFAPADEARALEGEDFLLRTGQQFHFQNEGFATFEAFLERLSSRKRKVIRRERRDALGPGIDVVPLTGAAIGKAEWDAFFSFYMDTGSRKWGRPYLTRDFFTRVGAAMADDILLVMARRGGRWIAGAINFIGKDALYGRNWGAVEEHPFLHFEVCYYQAVDWAIAHGLSRVEAGAQGEHKLARGYVPVTTYSAHDFADARLSRAVADYLRHERAQVAETIELYGEHTPFKKDEAERDA